MLTTYEVLAQPVRRSILDVLRGGERIVGELADELGLTQPATSKHLRILRDARLVTVRIDGPKRWYALRPEPLAEIDDWLAPYRWMWESQHVEPAAVGHLDRLGEHLNEMSDTEGDSDA